MSKSLRLKGMIKKRLTAAAKEIFLLFEETIAEYEKELSESKELTRRKQEQLDSLLARVVQHKDGIQDSQNIPKTNIPVQNTQTPIQNADSEVTVYEITVETPQIKEEPDVQCFKEEEEEMPVHAPGYNNVSMRREPAPAQVDYIVPQDDTRGKRMRARSNVKSDSDYTEFSSDSDTLDSSDFEDDEPSSSSAKARAKGRNHNQSRSRGQNSDQSPEYTMQVSDFEFEDDEGRDPSFNLAVEKMKVKSGGGLKQPKLKNKIVLFSKTQSQPGPSSSMIEKKPETITTTEIKNHKCPHCVKTFSSKYQLDVHIRIHTGEAPFSCNICNKTLNCQASLDVHIRQHDRKSTYSCPVCGKVLSSKTSVIVHARQHKADKTFSCTVCNKTFGQQCILQMHMKMHEDEKLK